MSTEAGAIQLIVDPESKDDLRGEDPGSEMAAYLVRHGVQVNLRYAFSRGQSIAEVIVSNATKVESDLVVFGAYSRSQVSEALLGGVSRTLLANVPFPLFVSC